MSPFPVDNVGAVPPGHLISPSQVPITSFPSPWTTFKTKLQGPDGFVKLQVIPVPVIVTFCF